MRLLSTRSIGLLGVFGTMLLALGCSSTTRVNFTGPPGTILFLDGKPHHLPTEIAFSRPLGVGETTKHDISLVTTVQSRELRARGHIDAFGYTESDVDKLAVPTCDLEESHLTQLLDGRVVVFRGQSASRQHIYDLTLAKE